MTSSPTNLMAGNEPNLDLISIAPPLLLKSVFSPQICLIDVPGPQSVQESGSGHLKLLIRDTHHLHGLRLPNVYSTLNKAERAGGACVWLIGVGEQRR